MKQIAFILLAVGLAAGCFVNPDDRRCEQHVDCFADEYCDSDEGECRAGPRCEVEETPCDGACRTDFSADRKHCGRCGNACAEAEVCAAGECRKPGALTAGTSHACAVMTDRTLWCWGSNSFAQLGRPADRLPRSASPVLVTESDAVAANGDHTCLLSGGAVRCLGKNSRGEADPDSWGEGATIVDPHPIDELPPADALTVGFDHNCVLADGGTYCWGDSREGEITNEQPTDPVGPTEIEAFRDADALAAGQNRTCGVVDGGITCVGQEDADEIWTIEGVDADQLVVGNDVVCAFGIDARPRCWGSNTAGQLGHADAGDPHVEGLQSATEVVAGSSAHYLCAVDSGELFCWGGVPSGTSDAMSELTDVTSVAAGTDFACAAASGGIYCWGNNDQSQLGRGDDAGVAAVTW